MNSDEPSLHHVFYRLRSISQDTTKVDEINDGIKLSQKLVTALEASNCFSENESVEDISTGDLKFLLVPYYHATLLTRVQSSRKVLVLQDALKQFNDFLLRLWNYKLCGELAKKLFRDEDGLLQGPQRNVEFYRTSKIERLKREKNLQSEINHLEQLTLSQKTGAEDGGEYSWIEGMDEERERQIWLLHLEMCFYRGLTQRELLHQEIQILQFAEEQPNRSAERSTSIPPEFKTVVEQLQKRETIKSQVFRPSHILPTMTVEQFAALEKQRALSHQPTTVDENIEDGKSDDEEDVYKQREWDDWKDDHPRGYGNSKLKPCAQ